MPLIDSQTRLRDFERRVQALLPRLACFDAEDYLVLHPDLANSDPYRHFAEHGVWEQRRCITAERLTGKLSRATALAPPPRLSPEAMQRAYLAATSAHATLHLPARPTGFERQTAERLAAVFDTVGLDIPIQEGAPKPGAVGAIIVGPEHLFSGARDEADLARLGSALVVASAAPDLPAFGAQLPYLLAAAGVIAIESETYGLCQEAGVPAVWLGALAAAAPKDAPPTDHPLFLGLGRSVRAAQALGPWAERPIEVLAIQAATPARASAWERLSGGVAGFKSVVYQPPGDEAVEGSEAALRRYLYARSKIILHLHAEAPSALCSTLVEEASAAGAVILSEPARPHLLLKPGRHYLESSARRMPTLMEQLLRTDEGAAGAQAAIGASRRTLAAAFDQEVLGLALINLLSETREGDT